MRMEQEGRGSTRRRKLVPYKLSFRSEGTSEHGKAVQIGRKNHSLNVLKRPTSSTNDRKSSHVISLTYMEQEPKQWCSMKKIHQTQRSFNPKKSLHPNPTPFTCYIKDHQLPFLQHCKSKKYESAVEILINIFNYAIDIQEVRYFLKVLKEIGDFYLLCSQHELSCKYYKQLFHAAVLQKNYQFVAESLIGLAKCCDIQFMFSESISFLKKGLEYSWMLSKKEIELLLYDEIGKRYYRLGNIDKAKCYHHRYSHGKNEESSSPLKILAMQKIQANQQKYLQETFHQITPVFLVKCFFPIKNVESLPQLPNISEPSLRSGIKNSEERLKLTNPYLDSIQYQIKKIRRHWMFDSETEEPDTTIKSKPIAKTKKNSYFDFKLNQHLRMLGIKPKPSSSKPSQSSKHNESLEEKVQKRLNQPPLSQDWFQKIVVEVKNDQRRRVDHINAPIRMSRSMLEERSHLEKFRRFYESLLVFS